MDALSIAYFEGCYDCFNEDCVLPRCTYPERQEKILMLNEQRLTLEAGTYTRCPVYSRQSGLEWATRGNAVERKISMERKWFFDTAAWQISDGFETHL